MLPFNINAFIATCARDGVVVTNNAKTPERRAELLAVAREFNSQRKHIVPLGYGTLYKK
jgi:hypothetical protein